MYVMTTTLFDKPLEVRILEYIRKNNIFTPGQKVLAAVSGGPDSVCLLNILNGLRPELGISLHAAHLDHQLRGSESAGDALYVAELAEKLKIPFTIGKRDVIRYQSEKKLSLEEAAREVRYTFLAETALEIGAAVTATGHTLNDQVETVMLHIVRGTGTRGLRGLQPVQILRPNGSELTVVRPLLEVRREETEEYCSIHNLYPRNDSSNQSYSLLRNRVRHELLPLLKEYNSGIFDAVLRLGSVASDDLSYLDDVTDGIWDKIVTISGQNLIIDKAKFLELHIALKRNILRRAFERLSGTLKDIETRHIEEIIQSLNLPAGRSVSLPYSLVFYIDYTRYLLGSELEQTSPFPELNREYIINIPGDTICGGWNVKASLVTGGDIKEALKEADENNLTACLDFDITGDRITMRPRKRGDIFQPLGLKAQKKVGEFMLDARVPRLWRDRIPVFCSPSHIIWAAGLRIDDRAKVTSTTHTILLLKITRL